MEAVPSLKPRRIPWRERLQNWRYHLAHWRQRRRFARAVKLVREYDGIVVSNVAYQTALDRLAGLTELADQLRLSNRVQAAFEAHVEDVTRVLVLAAEIGDPAMQLAGRQDRYVNLRYRAMTPRKRAKMRYVAALEALEGRIGGQKKSEVASDAVSSR